MARYSTVHLDDLAGEGPSGAVRKVRWFREEVLFVVRGSGTLRVDGEEAPIRAGQFVRLDADAVRCPVAGSEGLEFVTFGAPVGGGYEPPDWG